MPTCLVQVEVEVVFSIQLAALSSSCIHRHSSTMSGPNLSLPTAASGPTFGVSIPKRRKKTKGGNSQKTDFNRALDEADDVSDGELVEAPIRRRVNDDYEQEDRDGDDAAGDADGEGEGEEGDVDGVDEAGPSGSSGRIGTQGQGVNDVSDEAVRKRDKKAKGERL